MKRLTFEQKKYLLYFGWFINHPIWTGGGIDDQSYYIEQQKKNYLNKNQSKSFELFINLARKKIKIERKKKCLLFENKKS